ncbi:MAG: nuclear transport factor 2 family protein [Rudaea sp.]
MIRNSLPAWVLIAVSVAAVAGEGAPASNVHLRAGPEQTLALFDEIGAKDKAVFDIVFGSCDIEALKPLVADDFEFYHDKDGLNETSGAHFIDDIAKHCERIKEGVDFRARRELVKGSLEVFPLNNFGAVETGVHRFYAIEAGKPDRLTETARFLQIWKKVDGRWRLARVVSYDHRLAK